MLLSLAIIFILGFTLGEILNKFKLPRLLGMLIIGILIGPNAFNYLDESILSISSELRRIALIIILTRAGLNMDLKDLRAVGRPAILMSFIPASLEIIGTIIIAPKLLGISLLDSAILGTVIAAVSPAVIVPKMLKLIGERYGIKEKIPQLIMAGSSVDDVFVIVLFTSFLGLAKGGDISALNFIRIPTSIIFGVLVGVLIGLALIELFRRFTIDDSLKVVLVLSISFILVTIEDSITGNIGFSGLLSIMSIGITIKRVRPDIANDIGLKYSSLWSGAELLLFVLVGATVDIKYVSGAGLSAVILIFGALVFRVIGVYICLLKTELSTREKIFSMIAYCPKATVQAAIGSIPLTEGLASGNIILTVAVLAIIITAPLGSFAIDYSYKRLLNKA
ncbi:MAG: cation:proton antiporter [Andreesenia angusta]|nr:cation:proton antiporter [Andreesenia angusta]